MKQTLCTLMFLFLMTSCATLFNAPHKNVAIFTTEPSIIIHEQDTIETIQNRVNLQVKRQNAPMTIVAITDSLTKTINVAQKKSPAFWLNIPFSYGLGMLVDMRNPRRFSYPGTIFINSADASGSYSQFGRRNQQGEFYLHISFPAINHTIMSPRDEGIKNRTGIGRFTFGVDYYHSKNQFVHLGFSNVSGGVRSSSSQFILGTVVEFERLTTRYISLSNNHKFTRLSVGYGLAFAQKTLTFTELIFFLWIFPMGGETVRKNHNAFGFVFPVHYQLGEFFHIGLVYRPTFFRPNMPDRFVYEHSISLDLTWRIGLNRINRN